MDISLMDVALAFGAGLASILSPCVLPVVPIIVTGTEEDSRWRPLAIVGGLALAFVLMGVVTSLFGALVAGWMFYLEKAAGAMILIFGLLLLLNVNLFKHLTLFNRIQSRDRGSRPWGALVLGASLGLIWIPCVGPMLSSVLAMVATEGRVAVGILLLFVYSLGFAVPMLLVAWSSQFFRSRFRALNGVPVAIRLFSGGVLMLLGAYVMWRGLLIV